MFDEIMDGLLAKKDLEVRSGTYHTHMCWHHVVKNGVEFTFGLDTREGGVGYYLERGDELLAEGSKSALISALERYGLLHELPPTMTQQIFLDLRC